LGNEGNQIKMWMKEEEKDWDGEDELGMEGRRLVMKGMWEEWINEEDWGMKGRI